MGSLLSRYKEVAPVLPYLEAHFRSVVCNGEFATRDIWMQEQKQGQHSALGEDYSVVLSLGPDQRHEAIYLVWTGPGFVRFMTMMPFTGPNAVEGEIRVGVRPTPITQEQEVDRAPQPTF